LLQPTGSSTRTRRPSPSVRRRRLQQLDLLPKRDQEALLRTIDAFLSKTRTA
jgi:hypothetical protein